MLSRILFILSFCLLPLFTYAQKAEPTDSISQNKALVKPISANQEEVLGTNESIKYMGSKLWFQMKKRLNLTSKEEEEAELKNNKKVILTFGSLKIEG